MERIDVGVAGATGMVGQRLVSLLEGHPWFRLAEVGASSRSAGRALGEVWSDDDGPLPPGDSAGLTVKPVETPWDSPLILSALPSGVAGPLEARWADAGHLVVSNASAHRTGPDIPLLVPEVNPDHLGLLELQAERWAGGIVTNPNCAVAGVVTALAPLHRAFGVRRAVVSTYQALSGAGRSGPSAHSMLDNVVPFIPGEEAKISAEPLKILGTLNGSGIEQADFSLSASAVRVPVLHGHLATVSVEFRREVAVAEAGDALLGFQAPFSDDLPSLPDPIIRLLDEDDRPQPRLDRDRGRGMTVTVGRLRPCESLGLKFVVLVHNLLRGAAGAALLNAELCHLQRRITSDGVVHAP